MGTAEGCHDRIEDAVQSLAACLVEKASRKGITFAFAESCTGGRLCAAVTSVPGASVPFRGGLVAYSNEAKERFLGVPAEVFRAHGAVSAPCAEAMAAGARDRFGVSWAAAVTGVAGPDGGTPEKPVGTVWFALAGPGLVRTWKVLFSGDRVLIQTSAEEEALRKLLEAVET